MAIWKNLAKRVVDSVTPDWVIAFANQVINEDFMKAFAGSCALVVCADGVIEDSEVDKVKNYIQTNLKELKGYDTGVIMSHFMQYCDAISCDMNEGRARVYEALKEIKHDTQLSKHLVQICCKIGEADGCFDAQEKQIVKDICEQLNVDYRNFNL